MSTCSTNAISNDKSFTKDYFIKRGFAFLFGWSFWNDRAQTEPVDISDVEITLTVKDRISGVKLMVENADWDRPEINHIKKEYDAFDNLSRGEFLYELSGKYPDDRIVLIGKGRITVS